MSVHLLLQIKDCQFHKHLDTTHTHTYTHTCPADPPMKVAMGENWPFQTLERRDKRAPSTEGSGLRAVLLIFSASATTEAASSVREREKGNFELKHIFLSSYTLTRLSSLFPLSLPLSLSLPSFQASGHLPFPFQKALTALHPRWI